MAYYKFLTQDGRGPYSDWRWPLPTKNEDGTWTPGEWTPVVDTLVACERGYHVCDAEHLLEWANTSLYEMEVHPDARLEAYNNKSACTQCRLVRRIETWNDTTARLFACDCAERVLPIFERKNPNDKRPRVAIETARRYAKGEATQEELVAAGDAAGDAARAAWDAWDAARAAARAAAWAAWAAAWDAWDAWDAAWAAARAAAWAAWDAWDAAGDAARAAWVPAGAAARAAEKKWQTEHLQEMLGL